MKYLILILVIGISIMHSCRKDDSYFQGQAAYRISTDTLLFDTVFTTIGSATRILKIYNDESQPILVDISLQKGTTSFFRMNADGFAGKELKDIEIQAKDSIYVFLEVTIDPDNPLSISPFVVEENLIVKNNNTTKNTLLLAFGQNANYIPKAGQKGLVSSLCSDFNTITWDDPKPYVIYGVLIIDSCQLILPEGTNVYVHGGIFVSPGLIYNEGQIIVLKDGSITSKGTVEKPVKIEGDRLEPEYDDVKGQWVGLRILNGSKNNNLNHTIIRNGIVGIQVDSGCELSIKNSIIENTSASGLIGLHSTIYGENLLIHNNGGYAIQMTYGGDYTFKYSTLASYVDKNEAIALTNFKCLDDLCLEAAYNPVKLSMTNCILGGGSSDEILFSDYKKGQGDAEAFVYEMSNCIVKIDSLLKPKNYPDFFTHCIDCYNLKSNDKLFLSKEESNYTLDTMSVARMRGKYLPEITIDLLGKMRKTEFPDLGCYEFE